MASAESAVDEREPSEQLAELPRLVKRTRDELFGWLRENAPQQLDWVERVRAARAATPTVVVVGEAGRGKSSLVNALLQRPGLSPVDAARTTSTYVWFRSDAEWAAHAHSGTSDPAPVAFDALRDRVLSGGQLPEEEVPARSVHVGAPVDLLDDLSLVDTPGVGGLESAHGDLALEAASSATAVLFVADASAPLTRGELDFLDQVGDRVETVLLALTKTDRHRGWRRVLDEDRELLAEHAPRFADAPIHPVSPRLLELVGTAPNTAAGEQLRERSGVDELRSALRRTVVGRSAMLGEANTLRALSTVLAEVAADLQASEDALAEGADQAQRLRDRREQLTTARRSSTRGWQVTLRAEMQRTRVETNHQITREMREVQNWFRRTIEAADRERLAELSHQVDAALEAACARVGRSLSERLDHVADATLAELFSPDEITALRARFARGEQAPIAPQPPEQRPSTAEDKLLVVMGVSGGLGAGRAAMLPLAGFGVAALNPVVLPVTIALGLGAGWWLARTRKHTADKQHVKQWLGEAIVRARSTLEELTSEQLIEAEQQLSLALDDALSRRIDTIDEELREVDRALRMDEAERADERTEIGRRLGAAADGRAEVERLLERIRGLRDRQDLQGQQQELQGEQQESGQQQESGEQQESQDEREGARRDDPLA